MDQRTNMFGAPALAHILFADGAPEDNGFRLCNFWRPARPLLCSQTPNAKLLKSFFPEVYFAMRAAKVLGCFPEGFFRGASDHQQPLADDWILNAPEALFDLCYGVHWHHRNYWAE